MGWSQKMRRRGLQEHGSVETMHLNFQSRPQTVPIPKSYSANKIQQAESTCMYYANICHHSDQCY